MSMIGTIEMLHAPVRGPVERQLEQLKESLLRPVLQRIGNSELVKEKIRYQDKGRLHDLLNADPPKRNDEIVEELFLAALSRFPTKAETEFGSRLLAEQHVLGAEDMLWALVNKPEYILNY